MPTGSKLSRCAAGVKAFLSAAVAWAGPSLSWIGWLSERTAVPGICGMVGAFFMVSAMADRMVFNPPTYQQLEMKPGQMRVFQGGQPVPQTPTPRRPGCLTCAQKRAAAAAARQASDQPEAAEKKPSPELGEFVPVPDTASSGDADRYGGVIRQRVERK